MLYLEICEYLFLIILFVFLLFVLIFCFEKSINILQIINFLFEF